MLPATVFKTLESIAWMFEGENVPFSHQGSIPKKKEVAKAVSRSARSGLQFPVGRWNLLMVDSCNISLIHVLLKA